MFFHAQILLVTLQKGGVEGAKQATISASELEANGKLVAFA